MNCFPHKIFSFPVSLALTHDTQTD
jgi:hypothetical protein